MSSLFAWAIELKKMMFIYIFEANGIVVRES